jgi:ABC-type transport system involved in multi-copper enzyme maturation permease subunit
VSGSLARIGAVALNTFREAVRSRVLYLLLCFALLMIVASRVLSMLTVGEEEKIIKDLGLTAIEVFGVLTALFVGVGLIFHEVERRTVQGMIALPLRREEFLLGKYLGLSATLSVNLGLMSLGFLGLLALHGALEARLLLPLLTILLELWLVSALAVFFSSYSTPMLAAIFTAALWLVGKLAWSFDLLAGKLGPGVAATLSRTVKWIVPNLVYLDVRQEVVHGLPLPPERLVWAILYVLAYTLVVLAAACLIFRRRSFS